MCAQHLLSKIRAFLRFYGPVNYLGHVEPASNLFTLFLGMIQSGNAPVICNHCPTPPAPTGNRGVNDFSSVIALLKALHCGDLLRVIALLFIMVNSTGVYLRNITSPAVTRHCGGTRKVTAPHINPVIPRPSP